MHMKVSLSNRRNSIFCYYLNIINNAHVSYKHDRQQSNFEQHITCHITCLYPYTLTHNKDKMVLLNI